MTSNSVQIQPVQPLPSAGGIAEIGKTDTANTANNAGQYPENHAGSGQGWSGLSLSFYLLWAGQFVSVLGTSLSAFALSVWLYQKTGSVLDFTGMTLAATLPALIVTPWAGSIADRFNKRAVLMLADTCAAIAMVSVAVLIWSEQFQVWQLYLAEAIASIAMAFSVPAAKASITMLVPKQQFGRAAGMFEVSESVAALCGPLLAGGLLSVIGLSGIIALDVVSFAIALTGLWLMRMPPAPTTSEASAQDATAQSLSQIMQAALQDFRAALAYFRSQRAMARMYLHMAFAGFLTWMAASLFTPLVLANHSEQSLAFIVAAGAVGGLLGGMVMVVGGGLQRWSSLLLLLNVGEGLALMLAGYNQAILVLSGCAFYVYFSTAVFGASVHAVWQRKVPLQQQGSVLAVQHAVQLSLAPLGALIGGGSVHYFFEPAMQSGAWLADILAPWYLTGPGRGIGVLFICAGLVLVIVSLFSLASRSLRQLEQEVADAI